jgi:hypothetical protein
MEAALLRVIMGAMSEINAGGNDVPEYKPGITDTPNRTVQFSPMLRGAGGETPSPDSNTEPKAPLIVPPESRKGDTPTTTGDDKPPVVIPPPERKASNHEAATKPEIQWRHEAPTAPALGELALASQSAEAPDAQNNNVPPDSNRPADQLDSSDQAPPTDTGNTGKKPPLDPPHIGQEAAEDTPDDEGVFFDIAPFMDLRPADSQEKERARAVYETALEDVKQTHRRFADAIESFDEAFVSGVPTITGPYYARSTYIAYQHIAGKTPHRTERLLRTESINLVEDTNQIYAYYLDDQGTLVRHNEAVHLRYSTKDIRISLADVHESIRGGRYKCPRKRAGSTLHSQGAWQQ